MPDPRFLKPWHGIPREAIAWNPQVLEDACIGCGTCVTGCNRLVYRYDFERRKAVVVDPLNCMVGCTTCANTCPTNALRFPPMSTVFALEGRPEVRHAIEDELVARRDQLAWHDVVPHPERVVRLRVARHERPAPEVLLLDLLPATPADALPQFIPGQYLEILPPEPGWLARAYSIGNAPRADGGVELQVRHVHGGRLSEWLFDRVAVGDILLARGPQGRFTLRSEPATPLIFVAGGTGFAPIKAMIEQRLSLGLAAPLRLVWGAGLAEDFYETDILAGWAARHPQFSATLAPDRGPPPAGLPPGLAGFAGSAAAAIAAGPPAEGHDAYVAGPPAMMHDVLAALEARGVPRARIHVDSFGV